MTLLMYLDVIFSILMVIYQNNMCLNDIDFLSRDEWGARLPKRLIYLKNPVPYVVIHEDSNGCNSTRECIESVQRIQNSNFKSHLRDFAYNFAVGGDGKVYEGTGWNRIGEYTKRYRYDTTSIGIAILGCWTSKHENSTISSDNQLETVKKLIFYGVRKGKIIENYTLLTQQLIEPQNSRNPRACPGKALSEELSKWPHFPKLQSES